MTIQILPVLSLGCLLFTGSHALNTRELVTSLPGFRGAQLPSNMYTGFVNVDEETDTHLFYMLVEAQANPTDKPLLWWMNGGPGASSFAGLFGENGPLLLTEENTLMANPYAWNTIANVLYVEFAPGIGYSYCSNSSNPSASCPQSSPACSPCEASDHSVAQQNVAFLKALLEGTTAQEPLFPEFKGRPLYIAGESYAGVYVPTLALALLQAFEDTSVANLHGLFVTDPCTSNKAQGGWLDIGVKFAYEKGLISRDTHDALESSQCTSGHTPVGDLVRATSNVKCRTAWRLYDIAVAGLGDAVHPPAIFGLPMYIDPLNAFGPSGGPDMEGYIGRADVRHALHAGASPNTKYHLEIDNNGYPQYTSQYAACNDHATEGMLSMVDVWHAIVDMSRTAAKSAASLRTCIISSGDIDPVVGMHGTEQAVESLGYEEVLGGARRPWFFNATGTDMKTLMEKPTAWGQSLHAKNAGAQIGGFYRNFETRSGVAFSFVSVRDSGHMTPAYAPNKLLHLISRALVDAELLSPLLPANFGSVGPEEFYGSENTQTAGQFAAWVKESMGLEYVGTGAGTGETKRSRNMQPRIVTE